MNNNTIKSPISYEIFNNPQSGDNKTNPCEANTKAHNQNDIEQSEQTPQVIPFKFIGGGNVEKLLHDYQLL